MPYHVPPSLPRRSRLVPWLGLLWIASLTSTTIGLVMFTMFAARDGMLLHDVVLEGHILWIAMIILFGAILIVSGVAWHTMAQRWAWHLLCGIALILLLVAVRARNPIETYGWRFFRDGYSLYTRSPWFLMAGAGGFVLTSSSMLLARRFNHRMQR